MNRLGASVLMLLSFVFVFPAQAQEGKAACRVTASEQRTIDETSKFYSKTLDAEPDRSFRLQGCVVAAIAVSQDGWVTDVKLLRVVGGDPSAWISVVKRIKFAQRSSPWNGLLRMRASTGMNAGS